jgi:hypothetical protein
MKVHYPGWVMRLYFDLDSKDSLLKTLCDLACSDNNLDICYVGKLPGTPMVNAAKVFARNWRMFPTLDPQVISYIYILRYLHLGVWVLVYFAPNADSRITEPNI